MLVDPQTPITHDAVLLIRLSYCPTSFCTACTHTQGVTHISRPTMYPEDPATDTPERSVAHFAHPIELEFVSRGKPKANRSPAMFFQVCGDAVEGSGLGGGECCCSLHRAGVCVQWQAQDHLYLVGGQQGQAPGPSACPLTHHVLSRCEVV